MAAPKPTYDNLEPLVASVEEERDGVVVTFRCPVTGTEAQARAAYGKDGFATKAGRVAKAGAMDRVRIGIVRKVQQSTGALGQLGLGLGTQAAGKRFGGRDRPAKHSEKAIEGGVVAAFEEVAEDFRWDDDGERWVSKSAPTGEPSAFDRHVDANPVTTPHDREMLARILATIAGAEGNISDDEREMFTALAPGTDLEGLIAKWTPAAEDLQRTAPGPTRETMLLLAWALAATDEDLSSRETELLDWYAAALGVAAPRAAELRAIAMSHVGAMA